MLYRINAINNTEGYEEFVDELDKNIVNRFWRDSIIPDKEKNLFYNGDFKKSNLFWESFGGADDTVLHSILKENNEFFLRMERISGYGDWQLRYVGRPIYYYSGAEYSISFDYRVIKGDGIPFCVGWWVQANGQYQANLLKQLSQIDKDWNKCKVKLKFESDEKDAICFLNSQGINTIIDIKNIRLTCNDTLNRKMFVDQFPKPENENNEKSDIINGDVNFFISGRLEKWKYAAELWRFKYSIRQKFFGNGFEYLKQYGDKFYDGKQLDYHIVQ